MFTTRRDLFGLVFRSSKVLLMALLIVPCSAYADGLADHNSGKPSAFDQLFVDPAPDQGQKKAAQVVNSGVDTAGADDGTITNKLRTNIGTTLITSRNDDPVMKKAQKYLEMIRLQVAVLTKKTGFFSRFQVGEISKQAELLTSMFSDKALFEDEVIKELNTFIFLYGELDMAAEAYALQARLYQQEDKNEFALLALLQQRYLYSQSSHDDTITQHIQSLFTKKNIPLHAAIQQIIEKASGLSGSHVERWAALLEQLPLLSSADPKFNAAVAASAHQFLMRYNNDAHADLAQNVYANHSLDDDSIAIFQYKKLLALYPDSVFRPYAFLGIGNVQRSKLKDYPAALRNYRVVIDQFPDSPAIKSAYKFLALTYHEHLKDYPKALQTLQVMIEKFDKDPIVQWALQNKADILNKRTKQYKEAIATYQKLNAMFAGTGGLAALHAADKLASSKLRDYPLLIDINKTIVRDYPNHDDAAKALFKIAKTYQDKMQNTSRATKVYKYLIQHYPKSSAAKSARRKVGK